jgi:anti-sigma regulatory factor (Ser/Thr protein kinase)
MSDEHDDDVDPEPFTLEFDGVDAPLPIRVRRWLASLLVDVGEDHVRAVLLVCTELVTNVYDHAPGPCRVRMRQEQTPCRVLVEVDDSSPDVPTVGSSRKGGGAGGRGMMLVATLAEHWSVTPSADGKTVWAQISCGDRARRITRCPSARRPSSPTRKPVPIRTKHA